MTDIANDTNRDRFLTVGWNNALATGLGLPAVVIAAIALAGSTMSDRAGFIWLVIVGVVY